MTVKEEEAFVRKLKNSINKIFLVAIIDRKIVGILTFEGGDKPRDKHRGELGISTLKSHWGMGVGTTLMEHFLVWAKQTKIVRKVNLKVQTNNERAIKLYKKFGFKIEGTITRDAFVKNTFYDSYAMGLVMG